MGKLRVLDTNRLIAHWRRSRIRPLSEYSTSDAEAWADELINHVGNCSILTPIAIEFLCGTKEAAELALARAYLGKFTIADEGKITADDWRKARDLAAWVRGDAKPRDFADCLIAAIVRRLGCELLTSDADLRRRL